MTLVRDGRVSVEAVGVTLRDALTDQVLVSNELRPGDIVLLNSARTLTEGTQVALPREDD